MRALGGLLIIIGFIMVLLNVTGSGPKITGNDAYDVGYWLGSSCLPILLLLGGAFLTWSASRQA